MENLVIIHLNWVEHEWNDKVYEELDTKKDFGIYQVYGDHPVYGEDTLLYIGKAQEQTYSKRLKPPQHDDFIETNIKKISKINVSYFTKNDDVEYKNWGFYIGLVEKLLIRSHIPAYNAQDVKGVLSTDNFKNNLLVLNWGDRGKLLPEVSSLRYSYYYWDNKLEENILKEK
jgi:hypothetical protein